MINGIDDWLEANIPINWITRKYNAVLNESFGVNLERKVCMIAIGYAHTCFNQNCIIKILLENATSFRKNYFSKVRLCQTSLVGQLDLFPSHI